MIFRNKLVFILEKSYFWPFTYVLLSTRNTNWGGGLCTVDLLIKVACWSKQGSTRRSTVLSLAFHLGFPYLFHYFHNGSCQNFCHIRTLSFGQKSFGQMSFSWHILVTPDCWDVILTSIEWIWAKLGGGVWAVDWTIKFLRL